MQAERTRTEWFIWHIRQVPFQLAHMRTLAESTLQARATGAGKITGTKEVDRLPFRVDPADDADQLWAELVIFGREVAERIGGASPRPLRAGNWAGRDEPQGLPVCTPSEAFSLAAEVIQWMEASAHQIVHDETLGDSPDHLAATVRRMRARYPRSEPKFKAYRPRPCPIPACGERMIEPVYDAEGLAGYRCDNCEAQWDRNGAPVDQIDLREREGP